MCRLTRLLLCCLMALALPVQGLAAVVRLHCQAAGGMAAVPAHAVTSSLTQANARSAVAAAARAAEPLADHARPACPAQGHGPGQHPVAVHGGTAASPADTDAPADASHRCSACAACGTTAALATALAVWPGVPPHASPWLSQTHTALPSVALALPERPPRPPQA